MEGNYYLIQVIYNSICYNNQFPHLLVKFFLLQNLIIYSNHSMIKSIAAYRKIISKFHLILLSLQFDSLKFLFSKIKIDSIEHYLE